MCNAVDAEPWEDVTRLQQLRGSLIVDARSVVLSLLIRVYVDVSAAA